MGYFDSLPMGQGFQSVRQNLDLRHRRAVDEDGNYAGIALQRGFDLDAHEIMGIVETTLIVPIANRKPVPSDNRDESITIGDSIGQDFHEIEAGLDIVDIEENPFAGQPSGEAVVNPPSKAGGILSPIADKNAAGHTNIPVQKD
jgi:hypothetical protein